MALPKSEKTLLTILKFNFTSSFLGNRTVGMRLGKGESLDEISSSMQAVAEGILTSKAAHDLAMKEGIECPVISGIYKVLHQGADPLEVIKENMTRSLKPEVNHLVAEAAQRAAI